MFSVIEPNESQAVYEWNFGDSVHSSKVSASHTFDRPGTYTVTLKTTDQQGTVSTETTVVSIPFFTLSNPIVLVSLISLVTLLILACISLVFLKPTNSSRRKQNAEEPVDDMFEDIPTKIHVKEE